MTYKVLRGTLSLYSLTPALLAGWLAWTVKICSSWLFSKVSLHCCGFSVTFAELTICNLKIL